MKLPDELDPSDLPDIKSLSKEELAKVPHDVWRLYCSVESCDRFTRVKDFGIWPLLAGRFNGMWINLQLQVFFCAKHWKLYRNVGIDNIPFKPTRHIDEADKTIFK